MPDYLTVVYAYLPMTLAANLAYYLPAMITESGKILPVFAQNLGYTDIFLPSLSWDVHVATFLQGVTLLGIVPVSIYGFCCRVFWSDGFLTQRRKIIFE